MDRNGTLSTRIIGFLAVALRKESVDRNSIALASMRAYTTSLSARRAWIEITRQTYHRYENQVALRKESVDRNNPETGKG